LAQIGRVDLYRLMWTKPGVEVARLLDISGPGLTKLCRRHNVPCPGRGYWRRVEVGTHAIREPLPEPSVDKLVRAVDSTEVLAVLSELPSLDAMPEARSAATGAPRQAPKPAAQRGGKLVRIAPEASSRPSERTEAAELASGTAEHSRQTEGAPEPALLSTSVDSTSVSRTQIAAGGPTALPPSFTVLTELADQLEQVKKVEQLLASVELELELATPACAAVIRLWMQLSRVQLADSQPVRRIVDSCNRIATGAMRPGW
jgi:hypothetical protein